MYCDLQDVEGAVSQPFSDHTVPSVYDVEAFITTGGHIINSFINGQGYVLPVVEAVSPIAYAILKDANCFYAASRVKFAQSQFDQAISLRSEFNRTLDRIADGSIKLIDAPGAQQSTPSDAMQGPLFVEQPVVDAGDFFVTA